MSMKSEVPLWIFPAVVGLILLGSGLSATVSNGIVPVFSTTSDPIREAMCKNPALIKNELCIKKDSVVMTPPAIVSKIEPIGCIQFKDREGEGYTRCTTFKGVLSCEVGKC